MKRLRIKNCRIILISAFTAILIMAASGLAACGAPTDDDTALSEIINSEADSIRKMTNVKDSRTEEYRTITSQLVSKLDSIEQLSAGTGAGYDLWTDPISDPETGKVKAALVNDSRFDSVDDIRSFMHSALTDDAIKSRYPNVIDCSDPLFFERNGNLYVDISRTKGSMGFLTGKLIELHEIDDNSFSAVLEHEPYYPQATTKLTIVSAEGGWKINSIDTADI